MTPIRCLMGLHTGQAQGGTMMFTCPRCGGSFWQRKDYSAVTRQADAMIDRGDAEGALRFAENAVREGERRR